MRESIKRPQCPLTLSRLTLLSCLVFCHRQPVCLSVFLLLSYIVCIYVSLKVLVLRKWWAYVAAGLHAELHVGPYTSSSIFKPSVICILSSFLAGQYVTSLLLLGFWSVCGFAFDCFGALVCFLQDGGLPLFVHYQVFIHHSNHFVLLLPRFPNRMTLLKIHYLCHRHPLKNELGAVPRSHPAPACNGSNILGWEQMNSSLWAPQSGAKLLSRAWHGHKAHRFRCQYPSWT